MTFKKVDPKVNFPKMEEEILKFWDENRIFEKSVTNREGAKRYSFYDGPPFATGTPHYGHIVASAIKDMVPRYWTMRGFQVERKWGWDCHGLPIENIAEKALGIKHKKEIEEMGVAKFNETCRSKVLEYVSEWRRVMGRFGRWADMEHAYSTMDKDYMESVWWVFKMLWDKGLIYESYRSMHICPRCETTLSQSEVSEGYKDVKDLSVVVKFELTDDPGTFVLAWTTTPWTLPGNVALAVGESMQYGVLSMEGEEGRFIVAKDRIADVLKDKKYELLEEISGNDLIGKSYKPLFDYYSKDETLANRENGWKIYHADFVTTDMGTGIAHEAPAFGEDDMELGKKNNLPWVQHVHMDGTMKAEVTHFAGKPVKPVENPQEMDIEIIKHLAHNGQLFSKEKYEHSYPHCWRCDTPLLNYATSSWFVSVTKIKERMLALAKDIHWSPEHVKEGRFGKWLEGARDWSISRQRYWGSAMPLWKSEEGDIEVIGSVGDLYQMNREFGDITRVLFVRHGERGNTQERVTDYEGVFDLSEAGHKQAESLLKTCAEISIDAFISSPVARCVHTIDRLAASRGMSVATDKRLTEINNKNQGQPFIDRPESLTVSWNGGESFQDVIQRVTQCLSEVLDKYRGKTIMIAAHGDTFHILRREYEKLCSGQFPKTATLQEMYFFTDTKLPIDLHKHLIDSIRIKKNGKIYRRIPDILDTWFDSGSMPYAQAHYPFENKEKFEASFPAQFIAEGIDQTRAWFYYLHVLATGVKESNAFQNVIVNGIVLAEDGKKMSKRLRNYPDPMEIIEKHGADALRFYLLSSPIVSAENLNFSERDLTETSRNVFRMLWNSYSFFVMYADIDTWEPNENAELSTNLLDRWILSELQMLIREVDTSMERYELAKATRTFMPFIDDLSNWYIRRNRKRFWKSEDDNDKNNAYQTLYDVLVTLSKLMAPFTPFLAEEMYRNLTGKESVHLAEWPIADENLIDEKLNELMTRVREIVNIGLQVRAQAKTKVRQPLVELQVTSYKLPLELQEIIKEELNVKEFKVVESIEESKSVIGATIGEIKIGLNIEITPELKLEGDAREIIRAIQEGRKKAGFEVADRITLGYQGMEGVFNGDEEKGMKGFEDEISKEVLATEVKNEKLEDAEYEGTLDQGGETFTFQLKRV